MRPSFTVPHLSWSRPTKESRWAKRESLESTWNSVSIWKMAFRPAPSFSCPRMPKRELEDSISVRRMIEFSPAAGVQIVHVAWDASVAPDPLGNTSSGYTLPYKVTTESGSDLSFANALPTARAAPIAKTSAFFCILRPLPVVFLFLDMERLSVKWNVLRLA